VRRWETVTTGDKTPRDQRIVAETSYASSAAASKASYCSRNAASHDSQQKCSRSSPTILLVPSAVTVLPHSAQSSANPAGSTDAVHSVSATRSTAVSSTASGSTVSATHSWARERHDLAAGGREQVFGRVGARQRRPDALGLAGCRHHPDEDGRPLAERAVVHLDGELPDHARLLESAHPVGDGGRREVDPFADLAVRPPAVRREQSKNDHVCLVEFAHDYPHEHGRTRS